MGGYAFNIEGTIEGEYYEIFKSVKRDSPQRFRRVTSKGEVLKISWGTKDKRVTLPSEKFNSLIEKFNSYIRAKIVSPWLSTEYFFDYLDLNVMEIFFRGIQQDTDDEPTFYIQVNFRSCAGMCECSTAVGSHWADHWYNDNKDRLYEEIFKNNNFKPSKTQGKYFKNNSWYLLPIGPFGYASYSPGWIDDSVDFDKYSRNFQIDESSRLVLIEENKIKEFSNILDEDYSQLMATNVCRCQLCSPDFLIKNENNKLNKFYNEI